jgi:hypothetical protein
MLNAIKVLDLCVNAHKSVSFSRVDGLYRYTTASGSKTAPDLETLLRDLGFDTADAQQYQATQQHREAAIKNVNSVELYSALVEGSTIPSPPPELLPDVLVLQDLADGS